MTVARPDRRNLAGPALRIALIYAAFGCLWILFSDRILSALVADPAVITRHQTIKGLVFIAVTAALVFLLVRRHLQLRSRAEQALRESEARLRSLFENAPNIILTADRDLVIREINHTIPALSVAEVVGRSVMDFVSTKNRDMVMAQIRRVLDHGEAVGYETGGDPDIDPTWYAVRVAPITDDGRVSGLTMILTNITARKETERILQRERDFTDAILETAGALVVVLDRDGAIIRFNRACEQATGYASDEVIGEKLWDRLLPPHEIEPVKEIFSELRDDRAPNSFENHWITCSGGKLLIAWSNTVITGPNGEVDYIIGIGIDITERRRAERRQLHMMQELDHRVKNNLAAVLALAEQTMAQASTIEEVRESFVGRVRALAVTHEALAAARWEGVDFDRIARQILAPYMYDDGRRIELHGEPVLLPARTSSPVCMTMHELATNAAKYGALSAPGGHIELAWRTEHGQALLIEWIERGGPRADRGEQPGFGTTLIRGAIEHELRGRVAMDFQSEGLVCRITVPLTEEPDVASSVDIAGTEPAEGRTTE